MTKSKQLNPSEETLEKLLDKVSNARDLIAKHGILPGLGNP
jgi:hypothetical protein